MVLPTYEDHKLNVSKWRAKKIILTDSDAFQIAKDLNYNIDYYTIQQFYNNATFKQCQMTGSYRSNKVEHLKFCSCF